MNWYSERKQAELISLEKEIRNINKFLRREEVAESLKRMAFENFAKLRDRYTELKEEMGV